ncbi:Gfo/Idh/MocA family protein [Primorskyibacter sp. S187A]|uniref:Gfo/Idh/MocA family protein n=1 Tax=Primorskyibacter sp. S187A TaxID=3415130 RepID=UPI003C7C607D
MTRYGIIGCGMMGQEHIRNIALLDGAVVSAIYEPNPEMLSKASALVPEARVADTLISLVMGDDVDCLMIASPNFLHVEQLKQITDLRTLPILVEKPLATDPADEAFLHKLVTDYAAPIWVAMEYRYMPPLARFLELADEATGGVKMLTIREHRFPFLQKVGHWNRMNAYTGGTLVEKCCHFFDLMRLVTRSEPMRVMATSGQMVNHLDEFYDGARSDIWDSGYAIVDFAHGQRAMLELCMYAEGSEYQEVISAVGPAGKIECFIPGPGRFWPQDAGPEPVSKVVISPRDRGQMRTIPIEVDEALLAAGDHHGSTFYQHERFLKAVQGKGDVEVTLRDGWRAVAMGMAAQRSAEEHRMVELKEISPVFG